MQKIMYLLIKKYTNRTNYKKKIEKRFYVYQEIFRKNLIEYFVEKKKMLINLLNEYIYYKL